jgi:hypothetical protein
LPYSCDEVFQRFVLNRCEHLLEKLRHVRGVIRAERVRETFHRRLVGSEPFQRTIDDDDAEGLVRIESVETVGRSAFPCCDRPEQRRSTFAFFNTASTDRAKYSIV